jgi:lysylphosphatidylglycerol synthetase-like protein (DUF2156 family)
MINFVCDFVKLVSYLGTCFFYRFYAFVWPQSNFPRQFQRQISHFTFFFFWVWQIIEMACQSSKIHVFISTTKPKFHLTQQELPFSLIYARPKHSILRSFINWRFFVVAALLIKPKQQHGKNQNKNTGFYINCMNVVVVRTKINKN